MVYVIWIVQWLIKILYSGFHLCSRGNSISLEKILLNPMQWTYLLAHWMERWGFLYYAKRRITIVLRMNMPKHVSSKSKMQNWYVIKSVFSKLAILLRVCKETFSLNWKEEWNKEIHRSKKNSLFKTQVILFQNFKHIIKSGGVSVILNLFFYVFKGKQIT